MSKTILTQVSGFTPVIDGLLRDTDLETAVVFGMVWRYCQMESGECYASLQKIANRTGLSYKTVQRRMKILVKKGYLREINPHMKYSPHTYLDTGKAALWSNGKGNAGNDGDLLDQDHPHTGYKSKHMEDTVEFVADHLENRGELTPELNKILEDKINPAPTPKRRTDWYKEVDELKAGRSRSPTE